MRINSKDLAAGSLFAAIGGAFALAAWFNLRVGSALNMGPGYFPILLGLVLILLGAIIIAGAVGRARQPLGRVSWRGVGLVTLALVFFAFGVRRLGMAPALAITVMLAALGSDRVSLKQAALLSLALTALCALLFVYAIRLPIPLLGPWLGGY